MSECEVDAESLLNLDVWLHIATFLQLHDLTHGLALASRYLYAIANNDFVWATIVVVPCCWDELEALAVKHKSIRYIGVGRCALRGCLPDIVLDSLPDLTAVYCNSRSPMNWAEDHGKPLEHAATREAVVGSTAAIVELEMSMDVAFFDDDVTVELCQRLGGVRMATLEGLGHDDVDFSCLWSAMPLLHTLDLTDTAIDVAEWTLLVESHPHLHTLVLFNVSVSGGKKESELPPFPSTLTSLSAIVIDRWSNAPSSSPWYDGVFLPGLLRANAGTLVSLEFDPLTDKACQAIATMIALRSCKLCFAHDEDISDESVTALMESKVKITGVSGEYDERLLPAVHDVTSIAGYWCYDSVVQHLDEELYNLRTLKMSNGDLSLVSAELIGKYATLNSLTVGYRVKCDAGVGVALSQACTRLLHLDLEADEGWEDVAVAAGMGGRLRSVILDPANTGAVGALFRSLPRGYRIHYFDSMHKRDETHAAVREFVASGGSVVFKRGPYATDVPEFVTCRAEAAW